MDPYHVPSPNLIEFLKDLLCLVESVKSARRTNGCQLMITVFEDKMLTEN